MWLDGIVGALGAGAVAVSLLLGPALEVTEGRLVAVLTNLAYPVADVVLLALLVGVSAMLGVRRERTLLLGAAIAANLVGDIVYLDLATAGVYVEGGPLDLAWLSAMALFALAAFSSDPDTVRASAQAGALAHDLGLTLVAEGVEDAEAGAVLAWLGCDTAQGYVIARPMPVEAFVRWLRPPLPVQPL